MLYLRFLKKPRKRENLELKKEEDKEKEMIILKEAKQEKGYFIGVIRNRKEEDTFDNEGRYFKSLALAKEFAIKTLGLNLDNLWGIFKMYSDGTHDCVYKTKSYGSRFTNNGWTEVVPIIEYPGFEMKNGMPVIPKEIVQGIKTLKPVRVGEEYGAVYWAFKTLTYERTTTWSLFARKRTGGPYLSEGTICRFNLRGEIIEAYKKNIKELFEVDPDKFLNYFLKATKTKLAPNFMLI